MKKSRRTGGGIVVRVVTDQQRAIWSELNEYQMSILAPLVPEELTRDGDEAVTAELGIVKIRAELNSRGLEGVDLETLIDRFLIGESIRLARHHATMSTRDAAHWASIQYGREAARLVFALIAIAEEKLQ